MTIPLDPRDPLSSFEEWLRKIIGIIVSPPTLFVVGSGSMYLAATGFPRAAANSEWFLALFHVAELVVGIVCLVPPLIGILWLIYKGAEKALKAALRGLEWLNEWLKRIFPNQLF